MSDGELTRLAVLRDLDHGRLTTAAAGQLLGLGRRQVFRLLKTYGIEGAAGLISKRRGRPSNRRKPETLRTRALAIIRERYWDFGPTLAAEKLREVHGIVLGRETLRLWMIEAGIWADRKQRLKRVHQPRHRRECIGELVQVDGSEHWWFEVIFILEPSDQAKAVIGKRVTVVDYPDGRLSIRYKGIDLAYRTFDKLRQVPQAAIVENKRLGAALAFIREQQDERAEVRSTKAPRRRDQRDARLFKVG
jgi:hypothetical protein